MSNQNFAWKLIFNDLALTNQIPLKVLTEKHVLQLKGIFLSLDDDRDGFLTTPQLATALKLLGFSPRDRLLKKFIADINVARIVGQQLMNFKTSFQTFVSVISKEVKLMKEIEKDLRGLFSFMDTAHSGYISKRDLRHILVDVMTPFSMTTVEFGRFLKNLRFSDHNPDIIRIDELTRQTLFGLDIHLTSS